MTTGKSLLLLFGLLAVLSVLAKIWSPKEDLDGRIPLIWVSDNNPARTAQIDAFNEENPDLSLTLDFGNSGPQKIVLQSSSGVGPDIFDYSDEEIGTYVESGVLLDVTEAAAKMGFSAQKDGWPGAVDTVLYQGQQYGFPCNTGTPLLIYNKNVFDHFGVPYPTGTLTWEEFIALSKKFAPAADPHPQEHAPIFAITGMTWRTFFDTHRGEFFDPEGRLHIADNPELTQAFDLHRDFLFTHRLMPSSVEAKAMSGQGGWGTGSLNQFATARFAMINTGYYALISFGRAYDQQLKDLARREIKISEITEPLEKPLRLGAVLLPRFSDAPPAYRVQTRVAGINAKSPRREEALRFLTYLAGPTYSRLLNEGIDWLPGNPLYAPLGVEPGPADLDRLNMQDLTQKAMASGYTQRLSPFILTSDVTRVLGAQLSRLESDPALSTTDLLASANADLQTLLRRNLERSPKLKALFVERFGQPAYHALP